MISFKLRVGKVQMGQTLGGFTVIIPIYIFHLINYINIDKNNLEFLTCF